MGQRPEGRGVTANIDADLEQRRVIGDEGSTAPARQCSDYSRLSRQIKDAGLLERRRGYYLARLALNVILVAGAGVLLVVVGDSWWQLGVAVYWAIVSTQLGFTGHEAGHRQILVSRRGNDIAGYLHGTLAIGLSYEWWVDKHNRHHRHPNVVDADPDIGTGALVFTADHAAARGRFGRLMGRHQSVFFFPLLALEALNLHVASWRSVAVRGARRRWLEASLLLIYDVGYVFAIFSTMPMGKAFAFVAVHQALFGVYLGCSFAPNHKGMPMLTAEESLDFLRRQVLTSRNVRGGALMGALLGGLNWQIEHHLFPSMPRPNLRRAQPLIKQFCAEAGLPFAETSLGRSYRLAVGHLREVGRAPGTGPLRPEASTQ
jgi:fatty acid desaturase